jgi:hypothetical protein
MAPKRLGICRLEVRSPWVACMKERTYIDHPINPRKVAPRVFPIVALTAIFDWRSTRSCWRRKQDCGACQTWQGQPLYLRVRIMVLALCDSHKYIALFSKQDRNLLQEVSTNPQYRWPNLICTSKTGYCRLVALAMISDRELYCTIQSEEVSLSDRNIEY